MRYKSHSDMLKFSSFGVVVVLALIVIVLLTAQSPSPDTSLSPEPTLCGSTVGMCDQKTIERFDIPVEIGTLKVIPEFQMAEYEDGLVEECTSFLTTCNQDSASAACESECSKIGATCEYANHQNLDIETEGKCDWNDINDKSVFSCSITCFAKTNCNCA